MLKPKEHGGIYATIDFGKYRVAVMGDGTVGRSSTLKTYTLLHEPVPEAPLDERVATIRTNRAASPFLPYWDEVERYPFKIRAKVSALAMALVLDPNALMMELSELGCPVDENDVKRLCEAVKLCRARMFNDCLE